MLWAKETSSQSHYFSTTGVKVGDKVCLRHKAQPLGVAEEMPCLSLNTSFPQTKGPHELLGQPGSASLPCLLAGKKGVSVSGLGYLQGCGSALHPGGVGLAELFPEGLVPRCDAGELQQPGLTG